MQVLIDYWFCNDAAVDPQIRDDCARIRGIGFPVYLTTNQEHLRMRYVLDSLSLSDHFYGCCWSADLGCKKPDAGFFERAQNCTGGLPHDHVLVDDTAKNVAAASRAGWNAIHWQSGMSLYDQVYAVLTE